MAPKAIDDPTQEDPSSSISNPIPRPNPVPVSLDRNWGLAAFVHPVKVPQPNMPIETRRNTWWDLSLGYEDDDSDFKLSKFDRRLRSDSNDYRSMIAIFIYIQSIFN